MTKRGPGAFEAFAGEFFGGVEAEFAADGQFAGGVIEDAEGSGEFDLEFAAQGKRGAFEQLQADGCFVSRKEAVKG